MVCLSTSARYFAMAVDTAPLISRTNASLEAKGMAYLSELMSVKHPISMCPVVSIAKGMNRWFIKLTAAECFATFAIAAFVAAIPIVVSSVESMGCTTVISVVM